MIRSRKREGVTVAEVRLSYAFYRFACFARFAPFCPVYRLCACLNDARIPGSRGVLQDPPASQPASQLASPASQPASLARQPAHQPVQPPGVPSRLSNPCVRCAACTDGRSSRPDRPSLPMKRAGVARPQGRSKEEEEEEEARASPRAVSGGMSGTRVRGVRVRAVYMLHGTYCTTHHVDTYLGITQLHS